MSLDQRAGGLRFLLHDRDTKEFPPPEQLWMLTLQNPFGAAAGRLVLVVILFAVSDKAERSRAVDGPAPDAS
ncbi:hypothetical protein [Plantactinospora soyae]|uniref:Uncharacterized protein n=1 Tax=Plantactinospora soyae TaxID=1544732 RepID=A0A927R7W1_9ACTN|nr:hypothetical protein [Plantactinospora soyae]MBE1488251.1 hypothetical protein [Plantactinospora soyae]